MAIPILKLWENYYTNPDEGLGSSYERIILNKKILAVCKNFKAKSVLETPMFGFTGVSGINSMDLAKNGFAVTMLDHDERRVGLTNKLWENMGLPVDIKAVTDYSQLPFADNRFEVSWNFSALWFTNDLNEFLKELTRVTSRAVLLCVPNRAGIGFLSQKYLGKDDLKKYLKEENIIPCNITRSMSNLGWNLIDSAYIDCPPWPDIGMPKEKFLKILGLGWLVKEPEADPDPITILDYFNGKNPAFEREMLKYSWLEKTLPECLKKFWAHHRYFLFTK